VIERGVDFVEARDERVHKLVCLGPPDSGAALLPLLPWRGESEAASARRHFDVRRRPPRDSPSTSELSAPLRTVSPARGFVSPGVSYDIGPECSVQSLALRVAYRSGPPALLAICYLQSILQRCMAG
jgi:hypothetical protein